MSSDHTSFSCIVVEYLFLDGAVPTQEIRSKTKIIPFDFSKNKVELSAFPDWSYDGSSTNQASGDKSDLILKPVNFCWDSFRGGNCFLVLCEVYNTDGTPHSTNQRSFLRELWSTKGKSTEAWIGFEQEYTVFNSKTNRPYGWPERGYPKSQGAFYCGVGGDKAYGREIAEAHMFICIDAGLSIFGMNAEVMPAQWEFQIGYREGDNINCSEKFYEFDPELEIFNIGYKGSNDILCNPLNIADQLWIARWFLYRVAETHGLTISVRNKLIKGDWNGSGMHTNFSTKQTRDLKSGLKNIEKIMKNLEKNHKKNITKYGSGLDQRLTGLHETCHIDEFRYGFSDRGASVRISAHVKEKGYGYFEDRRPGANANPYSVALILLENSIL